MDAIYEFGPFRVDAGRRQLLRQDQPVPIAPKAFDLLNVLLSRPRQLVTKNDLISAVWPRGFVEEGNLSHNIFLLRRALGDTGDVHAYIVTVPGRGYQFVGEVRRPGSAVPRLPESAGGLPGALAASFGVAQLPAGGSFAITTGDFNGDGKLDLAVVNQVDGTVSILLNTTQPGASSLSFEHAASFAAGGSEAPPQNAPPVAVGETVKAKADKPKPG